MNITQEGDEQEKIKLSDAKVKFAEELKYKNNNRYKYVYNKGNLSIDLFRKYFEDLHYNKTEHKDEE